MTTSHVAVDLGASSGRVVLGTFDGAGLETEELHRFPTRMLSLPDGLHWDVGHLYNEILTALAAAAERSSSPASVAIDAWGVDYALVSESGSLLGLPFSYRDTRTRGRTDGLDAELLFRETGIQTQEINTLVQLLTEPRGGAIESAETLLFMADLVAYLLTGVRATDRTIASTSQLLSPAGVPADSVTARHGLPDLLPPLVAPGSALGATRHDVARMTGFSGEVVVAAGHDTACAVAAIPAEEPEFAFISCGTWGLAGFQLQAPRLSRESQEAGFTNEHGLDGTYLFMRNVTGLWLLNESMREWRLDGSGGKAAELVLLASSREPFASIVNPLDPVFSRPGNMPERIARYCSATGQPVPADPAQTTRCILDSLALSFADAIETGARIAGIHPGAIHMVGGGSGIADLCATVADLTGLDVIAGPRESSAIGNILIQARATGAASSVAEARMIARASATTTRYHPAGRVDRGAALDAYRAIPVGHAVDDD